MERIDALITAITSNSPTTTSPAPASSSATSVGVPTRSPEDASLLQSVEDFIDPTQRRELPPPTSIEKTMVFANTAENVAALARVLRSEGLECLEYHKLLTSREREGNLEAFRSGACNIIVCTDHAAR